MCMCIRLIVVCVLFSLEKVYNFLSMFLEKGYIFSSKFPETGLIFVCTLEQTWYPGQYLTEVGAYFWCNSYDILQ